MENLKIKVSFDLKPYKNIKFYWNREFYKEENPNQILIGEVDVDVRDGLNLSKNQISKLRNFLLENKSEVLFYDGKFYTITDKKLIQVKHRKLKYNK